MDIVEGYKGDEMMIRAIQDATSWAQDWGSDLPLVGCIIACIVLGALVVSLFKEGV